MCRSVLFVDGVAGNVVFDVLKYMLDTWFPVVSKAEVTSVFPPWQSVGTGRKHYHF